MAYQTDRSLAKSPQIDEDTQNKILELAAEGYPIEKIVKVVGVSWTTIARYMIRDPLFKQKWVEHRAISGDVIADKLLSVYDGAETVADAMIARGISDNYRTVASWRNPGRYGPKLNVEVQHTIDLSKALQQAEQRTIPILEQAKLDQEASPLSNSITIPIPTTLSNSGEPAHSPTKTKIEGNKPIDVVIEASAEVVVVDKADDTDNNNELDKYL